ncbi:sporulation membrane protein YtaF [Acetivibrio saccincola]|jgi:putative sporulation protein YtaF|uniref:Manganese efflux pump MntP n=1 Tax=Acetivibrio saccincola TaxID=1677857 RepID=A0A2K9EF26_9FIRM|nr:sporulation membrane protein YtaF [Acetivibrio saccincola]AUG58744.1 manganese efflux pump MntP [Acetivibrio saccincola]PQQ66157.1 sporulation membrane protein YtaF [Acetivibrio saccincola]HQD29912.1 sporulation membrane protein YtaF [Acetivibrio saccincola]
MTFSVVLLAISLSLDAFGVGLSYGVRKIKIPILSKIIICFFSIFYAGIALIGGKYLASFLPQNISKIIGITILFGMGTLIIIQALIKKDNRQNSLCSYINEEKTLAKIAIKSLGITVKVIKNPIEGDIDKSGKIEFIESVLLGLALSVDAIGVTLGVSLTGFYSVFIPFAAGIFQFAFLYAGTYLGEKFTLIEKVNKKAMAVMPGLLLIALAFINCFN